NQNQLEIKEKDGSITVKSRSGDKIITRLSILEKENRTYKALHESLSDYEQALTKKEIIGDTTREDRVSEGAIQAESQLEPAILRLSITPEERFYGGGAASRKAIQHREIGRASCRESAYIQKKE